MPSGDPSSLSARPAPLTLSPPVAYSPFAFSSGIRSVVDLAETSIAEIGTLTTVASANFSAAISNGNTAGSKCLPSVYQLFIPRTIDVLHKLSDS